MRNSKEYLQHQLIAAILKYGDVCRDQGTAVAKAKSSTEARKILNEHMKIADKSFKEASELVNKLAQFNGEQS